MEADELLVRWFTAPLHITISERDQRPLRYRGPVPPRGADGDALTASVTYDAHAATYR
jgi:hypothetical protein